MKKFIIFLLFLVMLFNYQILSLDYGIITTNTSALNSNSLINLVNTLTGISSIKYYPNTLSDNYFVIITHQANGYVFTATMDEILILKSIGSIIPQYYPEQVQTIHPLIYFIAFLIILAVPTKNNKNTNNQVKTTNKPIKEEITEPQIAKVQIANPKITETTTTIIKQNKYTKNIFKTIISVISFLAVWGAFIASAGYYIYYSYYIYYRNNGNKDWFIKNSLDKQTTCLQYTIITFLIATLFTLLFIIIKQKRKTKYII